MESDQGGKLDPVHLENQIIQVWNDEGSFESSIDARRELGTAFTFLEGPPTANGKPGIHHVLSRLYKDMVCRWKTMQGYVVERKAGWDTHGLPVEIEVQKKLDLMSNEAIEKYGIRKFNEACKESVWTYEQAWREMTERMGFWVDMDDPYVTLEDDYIESAWWSLKQMHDKGLLFRGHKVLPYCPQTGTSYSSHEVALGYKEVSEPSVFVKFKLIDDNASILAWTTTPWTLPGNVGLAVGPDVDYVRVRVLKPPSGKWEGRGFAEVGEELILAKELMSHVLRHQVEIISEMKGHDLRGAKYEPLFPGAINAKGAPSAWTVVTADFVTTTDGTGIVHTAVMYGEDDYNLGMACGFPAQHTVGMDGCFISGTHPDLDGRYVKECDDTIINFLHECSALYREQEYTHDYPHCWRTDHPLLYYAMDSWFVRMTAVRDTILKYNDSVEWAPPSTGTGRMGEWLSNLKDWAISRERYWGTPLPVWICQECGLEHCIGSRKEMESMLTDDSGMPAELHRPFVDDVKLNCPSSGCSGVMLREKYVMDCWFDSGCASFAQWHYPFENNEKFEESFPVDYICEAVDQTRGWFYSLLAVGATVFEKPTYRSCLSLGHILDKDGKKMSKSRGNVVNPWDHFNLEGADAIRWYMTTQSSPWQPTNFDPSGVRDSYARMFLTLWNVYRFHADYAELDSFGKSNISKPPDIQNRPSLDRWILSQASATSSTVNSLFKAWDFHKAGREIERFVVDDLSNWYVRRSRRRLWDESESEDKACCHHTLRETLILVSRLIAPISPFMSDKIHRDLTGTSVHHADWPSGSELIAPSLPVRDLTIEAKMNLVRSLAETGRRIRVESARRQRLPCRKGWIISDVDLGELSEILSEELNVISLEKETDLERFQKIEIRPNRRNLGKKCTNDLPAVLSELSEVEPDHFLIEIQAGIAYLSGYKITPDDVEVRRVEKDGYAAMTIEVDEKDVTLVLDMSMDPDLISKGLARDIIRRVQAKRKELNLRIEAEISLEIALSPGSPALAEEDWFHILSETRTSNGVISEDPTSTDSNFELDGIMIGYSVVPSEH
tara:strand:- start:11132 stop:14326 length:3195 start_codon:yes stop_codon:yes gene_type:complete